MKNKEILTFIYFETLQIFAVSLDSIFSNLYLKIQTLMKYFFI